MTIAMYQVDAFTDRVFGGNPAAVCPLNGWLPDEVMQAIAGENNLAETAFFVADGDAYRLRWFTPAAEVDLCGHATLASAAVLFEKLGYASDRIAFDTRSGRLEVTRHGHEYAMDFPATRPVPGEPDPALAAAIGVAPREMLKGFDHIAVLDSEDDVRALTPDFTGLSALDLRGVAVTARGTDTDYVCRFFAPRLGVNEDPVTGSAHCELAPYWGAVLGRTELVGQQVSARGGTVRSTLRGDRIVLRGHTAFYMTGQIEI